MYAFVWSVAATAGAASAFTPAVSRCHASGGGAAAAASALRMQGSGNAGSAAGGGGASRSVPFAPVPTAVKSSGLAGSEAEFDPLQISSFLNINWLRESEVKHGRIAMLAVVGTIAQQLVQLPFYKQSPTTLTGSHQFHIRGALAQVLLFTSAFEILAGTPAAIQMVRGSGRKPGYYGFDPLKLYGTDEAKRRYMELGEVKNGRLAMIAMLGFWHQEQLTNGMGVIEQLIKRKFTP